MFVNNTLFQSTDSFEWDKKSATFYADVSSLGRIPDNTFYFRGRDPSFFLSQIMEDSKLQLTNPRTNGSMTFTVEAIDKKVDGDLAGIRFVNENKTLKVVIFND